MNKFEKIYGEKLKTAEEIANYIESGFICASPTCLSQPQKIVDAVAERARKGEITDVLHHSLIAQEGAEFASEELKGKYSHVTWFTSGAVRKSVQSGISDFMPCHYSDVPKLYRDHLDRLDVFYTTASPMDSHGYFTLGLTASEVDAQLSRAKYVFLEINENMPRVFGTHILHISQVTALCESNYEIPELKSAPLSENDIKMGEMIAERIPNGATVQFGIGGIPNAVGKCLLDKKDLGIHTEMFVDSMVDLIETGAVTNSKKALNKGKTISAFCWGTKKMYDFLNDNVSVELHPVDYVNNPYTIGQFQDFISVNSCVEIDFLGQVCAESLGYKNFSGTGGQLDFVRGCGLSKGGKSFIAINSTAKGGTISKIKPTLTPGSAVTTGKNDVDYIVTEFGVVQLKGKTAGQRAKALISIAHPSFREELTAEAKKMNLLI